MTSSREAGRRCDRELRRANAESFLPTIRPWNAAYGPTTDLLIDLPSWCREDTLWSGDHSASSSPCSEV